MGDNVHMMEMLKLPHGTLSYPVYLPDATYGVVRAVDAGDLLECGVQGVVMNSFHLMQNPGSTTVESLGGLHRMSGWTGAIVTDSGGFQAYSLIRQNARFGKIQDNGLIFQPEGSSRKYQLTPEKSIQLQLRYGADVVICLDDCTHAEGVLDEQGSSVKRTIAWAKRCKKEYLRLMEQKGLDEGNRPKIFGVIQGGAVPDLRRECANALLEIGFDGFGFGGWPLDAAGNLLDDILGLTRELVPASYPLHALGVGHPRNLLACWKLGYQIFDCAMPTRDARHARLYVFNGPGNDLAGEWLDYVYVNDERHIKSDRPVSPYCDCHCCRTYSLGYLRHLFKLGEPLFQRLATLHNVRFMVQLTEKIRQGVK